MSLLEHIRYQFNSINNILFYNEGKLPPELRMAIAILSMVIYVIASIVIFVIVLANLVSALGALSIFPLVITGLTLIWGGVILFPALYRWSEDINPRNNTFY